ncbi:MAG: selenide, water dikinase SelD, partial [Desulfamplus sp.]|nr:selenide, water dikinase SelD [Desulfamplus sp.]
RFFNVPPKPDSSCPFTWATETKASADTISLPIWTCRQCLPFIHPQKILANQGLRPGDVLVITKPLGTGIVNTAIKAGLASPDTIKRVVDIMAMLNREAAQVMSQFPVSACTDVTGFGLLGHLSEMVHNTDIGVTVNSSLVPIMNEAVEFASMGLVPAGSHNNREFRQWMVTLGSGVSPVMRDILFDPQTSGGLLMGCPEHHARTLVTRLKENGVENASVIGFIHEHDKGKIIVT